MPQILFHKFSLMLVYHFHSNYSKFGQKCRFLIFWIPRSATFVNLRNPWAPFKNDDISRIRGKKCEESDSLIKFCIGRAKKKFLTNYRKKNVFLAFCSLKLFSFKPKCIKATMILSQLVESFHLIPLLSFYLKN